MNKIGILVPAYNVEKYIRECLMSILNQSLIFSGRAKIELYVIDDCSHDNTFNIIDDICSSYQINDIFTISWSQHKNNKGIGATRNELLEMSKNCDYICFMDSDDAFLDTNVLEGLFDVTEGNNCDICLSGIKRTYDPSTEISKWWNDGSPAIIKNKIDALEDMLLIKHGGAAMVGALYKRALFEGLEFPETVYEDTYMQYRIFDKAEKVAFINSVGYLYRIVKGSITHSRFNPEKNMVLLKYSKDIFKMVKKDHPEIIGPAYYTLVNNAMEIKRTAAKTMAKTPKQVNTVLRKSWPYVFKSPEKYFSKKKKVQVCMAAYFGIIFYMLVYVHDYILKKD